MIISTDWPPNIEQIELRDPEFRYRANVLSTYGDTLYNPHNIAIAEDVMVHEEVHSRQHLAWPTGAWGYTERCFSDKEFFIKSEVEAYQAQYQFLCKHMSRQRERMNVGIKLASRLCSKVYGFGLTAREAFDLIKGVSRSAPEQSHLANNVPSMDQDTATPTGVPAEETQTPAVEPENTTSPDGVPEEPETRG